MATTQWMVNEHLYLGFPNNYPIAAGINTFYLLSGMLYCVHPIPVLFMRKSDKSGKSDNSYRDCWSTILSGAEHYEDESSNQKGKEAAPADRSNQSVYYKGGQENYS
jgi:hypothetical protein